MTLDLLVLIGAVIVVSFMGDALSRHAGIPDALLLSGVGIIVGLIFHIDISESLRSSMSSYGRLALPVLMLQIGLRFDIKRLSHQTGRAVLVAFLSFATAAFLLYCALSIGLDFRGSQAWAIAAALACTSADMILPLLGKKEPSDISSPLLEAESALSSALAVIVVLVLTKEGRNEPFDESFWRSAAVHFLIGGGMAFVLGLIWLWLLSLLGPSDFSVLLTLGLVFLLMGLVERLAAGSGALAVLVFGMVLANRSSIVGLLSPDLQSRLRIGPIGETARRDSFRTQEGILLIMRGSFFLFLGLLFKWPGYDLRIWLGMAIAAVAVILAREISVQIAGWAGRIPGQTRAWLRLSAPRGLTSAVLVAILLPWVGSGPWQTVAITVVLVSNLRLSLGAAKHSFGSAGLKEGH